jgi:hypothetical protein
MIKPGTGNEGDANPVPKADATPAPKVVAATAAAAAATCIVVLISVVTGGQVPVGVEGALATLLAFAAGYITPPRG